jgi:hypothetical protein
LLRGQTPDGAGLDHDDQQVLADFVQRVEAELLEKRKR